MSNPSTFFESSQSITGRLAELHNFIWPTVAALWNLRWQVQGYVNATGKREIEELHERFIAGSGVKGANLKVACLETSWESQQEQFARFLLFELCGLFEAWLDDVVPRSLSRGKATAMKKALQFPSGSGSKPSGLSEAMIVVRSQRSTLMHEEVLPSLRVNPKNSWANVESLLFAYRYFKECRNVFIHTNGLASATCVDAQKAFVGLPLASLYYKRAPLAPALVVGHRVSLPLHDIVGLSNIVHRLVVTLDAMLATTEGAERDMLRRLKQSSDPKPRMFSTDPGRRQRQITSRLRIAGLPAPSATARLDPWLVAHRLALP